MPRMKCITRVGVDAGRHLPGEEIEVDEATAAALERSGAAFVVPGGQEPPAAPQQAEPSPRKRRG